MRRDEQDPNLKRREAREQLLARLIATAIFVVCGGMGLWAATSGYFYFWAPSRMNTSGGIFQLSGEQGVLMGLAQISFGTLVVLIWVPLRDAWRVWMTGCAIIAFFTLVLAAYLRFF